VVLESEDLKWHFVFSVGRVMTCTQTGFDVVTIYWRKLQISDNWQNMCTDPQGRITVLYNQALAWDFVRSWLMLPDLPAAVINFEFQSESVSYLLFLNLQFSVTWTMQSEPVSSKSLPPKTSTEQLNKKLDNSWYLGIHYLAAMSPWPNGTNWIYLQLSEPHTLWGATILNAEDLG